MANVYTRRVAATLLAVMTAVSSSLLLADSATQTRLDSLERKLDSRGLMDMSNRIEQMQRDIQQLRGDLEVQAHTLEEMQRRSREQYLDIDRRLQQFETGQTATPPVQSTTDTTVVPPVAVLTPAPSPAGAGERADYDKALAILREGRYAEATQAFNAFLANYPSSEYADNASYWLGETYYVNRDFKGALASFKGLVDNYPNSPKASDSLLKMGYIYYEQKDWAASRQALELVVSDYPGTTATRLAHDRLLRMTKEGH